MIRALYILKFRIESAWWVLTSNILRRHSHDGPTLDYCSCGCPIWGCQPCGGTRLDKALDTLGATDPEPTPWQALINDRTRTLAEKLIGAARPIEQGPLARDAVNFPTDRAELIARFKAGRERLYGPEPEQERGTSTPGQPRFLTPEGSKPIFRKNKSS